MKRAIFFALLLLPGFLFLFTSCSSDETVTLESPEGENAVVFMLKEGKPLYKVTRGGRTVVDTSGLGFELKDMPSLEGNFKLEKAVMSGIRERWEPLWWQRNKIRNHYNQLLVTIKEKSDPGRTMEIESRAYEDGVGFRYIVPFRTPWRTIQLADEPGELIESSLILNFNEPDSLEDDSWIRPMRYIGIWWGMHIGKYNWTAGPKHGATTENAKAYIDFAAYAQKKGIYLIAHNETGGNAEWYEKEVDVAFALYEKLGIHAIKTGYVGKIRPQGQYHHGQWMVNHLALIVKKAAEHKIMVDAHETIKATGLERTWPNFMSREWGRGYTPDNRVHSTVAKQLALMVVIYSPLQMAADLPENYKDHPAFQFIKDVPADWDDTKVLNGKIGDYVTIARKKKDGWYIGSINDEDPREFTFTLDFLDEKMNYEAVIYADGPSAD